MEARLECNTSYLIHLLSVVCAWNKTIHSETPMIYGPLSLHVLLFVALPTSPSRTFSSSAAEAETSCVLTSKQLLPLDCLTLVIDNVSVAPGYFDLLSNVEKTSYVLGSEHWEKNFNSLLFLVKEYIVDIWEVGKQILFGDNVCPSHLQSQSSVGDLGGVTGVDGHRSGKLDKRGKSVHVKYM